MFALLKKMGWATSLSAGESGGSISSRSIFMIHIELTDAGLVSYLQHQLQHNDNNSNK